MVLFKSSVYVVLLVGVSFSNHRRGFVEGLSSDLSSRSLVNPCSMDGSTTRRNILGQFLAIGAGTIIASPLPAFAAVDCVTDCLRSCQKIAPKDPAYCDMNCKDYCAQEDRTDGLSGSVSAANGEVGILGGSFGQGTVPKGEDKPPIINLPGLDFSSEKGKKLLGYK